MKYGIQLYVTREYMKGKTFEMQTEKDVKTSRIIAVIYTTYLLRSCGIKAYKKNSNLNRIQAMQIGSSSHCEFVFTPVDSEQCTRILYMKDHILFEYVFESC